MSFKTKAFLAGAVLAAAAVSSPANAATFVFVGGANSPTGGFTVVNPFNDATGLTGAGFLIKNPPSDPSGAPPANTMPAGTSYLSVLTGGSATYTFSGLVSAFQFDWGSVDSYNTLTFTSNLVPVTVIPGLSFANAANGNQTAPGTNGLFTVTGAAGEFFTSVTFSSSRNSFEVDNLAVAAIPEPSTWALMFLGFGMIGATSRYRRRSSKLTYA